MSEPHVLGSSHQSEAGQIEAIQGEGIARIFHVRRAPSLALLPQINLPPADMKQAAPKFFPPLPSLQMVLQRFVVTGYSSRS
jgi:hypothetical protein